MSFKSGVVHDPIAITSKEEGQVWIDAIKDKYFDGSEAKQYKAPIDAHNWQLVPNGMKLFDQKGNYIKHVTYLIEKIGGKKFTRHLEECDYCSECKEQGFNKRRVV